MGTYEDAVRAAFEQVEEPIAVYDGDDLIVRAANPAGLALLGGPGAVGQSARELFSVWRQQQQLLDALEEVARTGRARTLSDCRLRVRLPDGSRVERLFGFHVSPWLGDDGRVRGAITRGRDVSARPRARPRMERRLESEPVVVRTLQDVLLPQDLPVLPGLHIDSSYLLAAEHAAAGGDWYDALVRPSGRVVLAVGDMVGQGASASAVMGQLRAVLHDRLRDDLTLGDALAAADRHALLREPSRAATLVVAELDVETGQLLYVTAGHPEPLVVGAQGDTAFLPPSGAGPLGTGSDFTPATADLHEGEMVVLYTDGAINRPSRTPAEGTEELAAVVGEAFMDRELGVGDPDRGTERVCRTGLDLLSRRTGHRDDITILAAQRVPAEERLTLTMPAEPQAVTRCRMELGAWLDRAGARSLDSIAIQHAVAEVVDNAVRHAYGEALAARLDPAAVCVEAALLPSGEAEVVVVDRGCWREPAVGSGGRGLALARGFMDQMTVERSGAGTRVRLRHRLARAARIDPPRELVRSRPGTVFGVRIGTGEVAVHGDVDARTVDELRVTLDRATFGRTTPVTVELSEVTHLGSTGVQLLFELLNDDPDVDLVAREGSVAAHVLDTVQLSHAT